jgi:asparagine synthase (glutamine-hydrolysing)
MCGLVGILNLDGRAADRSVLARMTTEIRHRGPDDEGLYVDGPLGLGFRRLSIIDLSEAGHQPMRSSDGDMVIVFNGEIYNYRELRAELSGAGVSFRSRSDTEVLLALYQRYGTDMLSRLRGMFAFAIWDVPRRRLFLARDRIGIKPLYYAHREGESFWFGSEIKGLVQDPRVPRLVSPETLFQYMLFGHSSAPGTMFHGIRKLEPGHCVIVENGNLKKWQYWDVLDALPSDRAEQDPAELVGEGLRDAVGSHMVSDVPVGAFLSGGIDSSAVVALMSDVARPVHTFSAGFDVGGKYNELDAARTVSRAFATQHHEQILTFQEAASLVETLSYHYDEPFADAAAAPLYLISRFARQHVKVVMSGEGSDEILAGYRRYALERFGSVAHLAPSGILRSVAGLMPERWKLTRALREFLTESDPAVRYGRSLLQLSWARAVGLLRPELTDQLRDYDPLAPHRACFARAGRLDRLSRVLYADLKLWLPDTYLEKLDKATMAVGLEGRVPFLDHPLVERAFSLAGSAKMLGPVSKYPLKRAMFGKLPWSILARKKHGFSVPLDEWFRGPLRDFAADHLLSSGARLREWLVPEAVADLCQAHFSGRENQGTGIWILLNLELWLRRYSPQAIN